jgi:AraC-like DNA-binding protein
MAEQVAESRVARPAPALRPFVEAYVGYRYEGFAPGVHAGLPSRHLTFVVSFDEPLDLVGMPGPAQRPERFWASASGLHTSPARIRHDGNQHGVQLGVTPAGARALFGMPAAELAHTVVHLPEVLGGLGDELVERLAAAPSWPDRFSVLDDVLGRALTTPREPAREVAHAWSFLAHRAGAVDIESLAREVGWSRRHLSEQFRSEYGLPPKTMARVLRFERAKWMLVRADRSPLATVAATCGYADQPHMTREWQELAGSSPSGWLAGEELPFVQDPPDPDEARWDHG